MSILSDLVFVWVDFILSLLTRFLDDAARQSYKDSDFGSYCDLESPAVQQWDTVDGPESCRQNALLVRSQLNDRVRAIIGKFMMMTNYGHDWSFIIRSCSCFISLLYIRSDQLHSTQGRDLCRVLFSLKQLFQEDKDLVRGFVALGGLDCLVSVGNDADQNYQNYILRALGQVMLYVDGMNGVMQHTPSIRWLYSLIASEFRLVVKTALKLLLVFVEYVEGNGRLLVDAIHEEDVAANRTPWSNVMK